jgi:hypothetical protein
MSGRVVHPVMAEETTDTTEVTPDDDGVYDVTSWDERTRID